ncbi:unnamed protein product [Durusdinium trenchii]|uniref:RRM domain-containing protein n=1 Tax=Durusdinium trenchii TaxID=1381693 RepID=A0ABP0KRE5_9DINO
MSKGGWGGYDDYSWMSKGKGSGKDFGKAAMMMSMMSMMMKGGKGGGSGGGGGGGKGAASQSYGKGMGNPTAESEVVFVGGLPRETTEEAITLHFSQFGMVQKVDMKYDVTTNVFRGFCFVTFASVAEAQAVFDNYDNNMFNGRWIDCKPAAMGKAQDPSAGQPPKQIPWEKAAPPPTGSTLRARGLPFSATKEQVEEFFAGYGMTGRFHNKLDYMGRPSGEVFVEFFNNDEAVRAFNDRNFQMMGNRYVELLGASDKDVQMYLDNNGKGAPSTYGPMKGGKGFKGSSPYDMMSAFFGY